jgi:hypothetical protein
VVVSSQQRDLDEVVAASRRQAAGLAVVADAIDRLALVRSRWPSNGSGGRRGVATSAAGGPGPAFTGDLEASSPRSR